LALLVGKSFDLLTAMLTRFHTTFEPEIGTDEEVFICGKDLPGNLEGYSTRPTLTLDRILLPNRS
jgi:hypothetical protein